MTRTITADGTTNLNLLLDAVTFSPTLSNSAVFRIISDRNTHFLITKTGQSATVSDMFVPANCSEFVLLNSGESLSVILAAGETSGDLWITKQRGTA